MAGQWELADEVIARHEGSVAAEWRQVWANEEAALAWHRGDFEKAVAGWRKQDDSAPVFFNRGMAALFHDEAQQARSSLAAAVAKISEDSSWHHLGKLYLALAEMRS